MSRIRSRGTRPEMRVHGFMKSRKIPHKMWPKMPGNPDILLGRGKTVIFIDGCFFHGCPLHFRVPKTNSAFWRGKIRDNGKRRQKSLKVLGKMGYSAVSIWEHDLKVANKLSTLSFLR